MFIEARILAFIGNYPRSRYYPVALQIKLDDYSGIARQVTGLGQLIYEHDQRLNLSWYYKDIPRLRVKFLLPSGVSGSGSFVI